MLTSDLCLLDGRLEPIERGAPSVASNTLHLGCAVFDGIMAYWNEDHWYLHRLEEHLERFSTGASRMDLATEWSGPAELTEGIYALVETLPRETHYLRPIAYRTGADLFFDTEVGSNTCVFAVPVERGTNRSYTTHLSTVQRVHHAAIPAAWKVSGAYANSYRCEQEARAKGYDTGLMLDVRGRVAETSTSNVFFVEGDTLVAPQLDGDVFPGITQQVVFGAARDLGLSVVHRDIWPEELGGFGAAMLCGTLSELHPISTIGETPLASTSDPVVRELLDAFHKITHQ